MTVKDLTPQASKVELGFPFVSSEHAVPRAGDSGQAVQLLHSGTFAGLSGHGLEKTLDSWRLQPLAGDGWTGSDVRKQQEVQALLSPDTLISPSLYRCLAAERSTCAERQAAILGSPAPLFFQLFNYFLFSIYVYPLLSTLLPISFRVSLKANHLPQLNGSL